MADFEVLEATFLGVDGGQAFVSIPSIPNRRVPLLGAVGLVATVGATILVAFSDTGLCWLVVGPGADMATQAELDAHAALKSGVHGIPAMSNGQGLLWNGTTWVATDLATQAEFDARIGQAIRRGTGTVTITNGTSSFSGFIAHGVGSTPTAIVATARRTADTRDDYVMTIVDRDATNFRMACRGAAAEQFALTNPTTVTFDWIAMA